MRYKLGTKIVIRTENAARPAGQCSAHLEAILRGLPRVPATFDYGCGKLRYKDAILRTTETLVLVDSEVQLSRRQIIHGKLTTIRDAIRRFNAVSAQSITEFGLIPQEFDRGFCINVLSVIPFPSARRNVLNLVRERLCTGGTCLFVVQYRNSDFDRMRKMKNARPWRDGFLIDSLRGHSFYGLISPERLEAMVVRAGFEVVNRHLNEGSVYLWVRSPKKSSSPMIMEISEQDNFRVRRVGG